MYSFVRITAIAIAGIAVCGATLLSPVIFKSAKLVVQPTVRADRLMMADAGAVRLEHGGEAGDRVKLKVVPYADDSIGYVRYRPENDTVSSCEEYYQTAGDKPARIKSAAVWNAAGTKVIEGQVTRPDGSTLMEQTQLSDVVCKRSFSTPQPDSSLFVTQLIKTGASDGKSVPPKTMDSTYFRPNGRKWAHLEFQWSPPEFREGGWTKNPACELFREEDETRLLRVVDQDKRRLVTHYTSDGLTVAFVQTWMRLSNSGKGLSFRLASVDEYGFDGKVRRTLVFDDDGQTVSLTAVKKPVENGTRVVSFKNQWFGGERRLIENLGRTTMMGMWGGMYQTPERMRFLYTGVADKVVQPNGSESSPQAGDGPGEISLELVKMTEKLPVWVEFQEARRQHEREDRSFLGARDDGDPCRWYLNED